MYLRCLSCKTGSINASSPYTNMILWYGLRIDCIIISWKSKLGPLANFDIFFYYKELLEDVQGERSSSNSSSPRGQQSSPMRVDFGSSTAPSMTSVTSESDHQNHVLQQYSLNQLRTNEHKIQTHCDGIVSPRSQALKDLRKSTKEAKEMKYSSENDGFTVPSPQLQLSEMWESNKSVPTVSSHHHFKPHSCGVIELDKQNLKVEPHMVPTAVLSTEPHMVFSSTSPLQTKSPVHTNPDENENHYSYLTSDDKPVMYNAWSVAKPNSPIKHSMLTSTRLMQKYVNLYWSSCMTFFEACNELS